MSKLTPKGILWTVTLVLSANIAVCVNEKDVDRLHCEFNVQLIFLLIIVVQ
jgi:hypothetical protein